MGAKRKAAGELSTTDMDALKEIVKSSVEDIMETKLTEFCTNFTSNIRSLVESVINEKFEAFKQQISQQLTTVEARHASEKEALTNKITALEKAVEDTHRSMRANNLVLHGLKEDNPQTEANLKGSVQQLLENSAGGSAPIQILSVQRLGKPRTTPSDRPRPIRIVLSDGSSRASALQRSKDLRQRKLYLDVDLTPQQQHIHTSKQDRYRILKNNDMRPFWRGERLMVIRDGVVSEDTGSGLAGSA
jgi:hypothetical protein